MIVIHSLASCGFVIGVVLLVGIECSCQKRLYRGPSMATLYDKESNIIDEISVVNAMACATVCMQRGCEAFLFREAGTNMQDDHCITPPNEYTGFLNSTISGRTCQRWDRQYPHSHTYTVDFIVGETSIYQAHNYCRRTTDTDYTWCYTTSSVRWERCDVVNCMNSGNNCRLYSVNSAPYKSRKGFKYFGGT